MLIRYVFSLDFHHCIIYLVLTGSSLSLQRTIMHYRGFIDGEKTLRCRRLEIKEKHQNRSKQEFKPDKHGQGKRKSLGGGVGERG